MEITLDWLFVAHKHFYSAHFVLKHYAQDHFPWEQVWCPRQYRGCGRNFERLLKNFSQVHWYTPGKILENRYIKIKPPPPLYTYKYVLSRTASSHFPKLFQFFLRSYLWVDISMQKKKFLLPFPKVLYYRSEIENKYSQIEVQLCIHALSDVIFYFIRLKNCAWRMY